MNLERVTHRLAALTNRLRLETSTGNIFVPESPIDLQEEVGALLPVDTDAEDVSAREWLTDNGHYQRLLGMEWAFKAPSIAWYTEVGLLDLGSGAAFVVFTPDEDTGPTQVIARLQTGDRPALICSFLEDLLAGNGADYQVELFAGMPTSIRIARPELVDAEALKRGLWSFALAVSDQAPSGWERLAETIAEFTDRPNTDRLSEPERQALLDQYLGYVLEHGD
jgi:hypothetical protein